jgi:hypothetical protein
MILIVFDPGEALLDCYNKSFHSVYLILVFLNIMLRDGNLTRLSIINTADNQSKPGSL